MKSKQLFSTFLSETGNFSTSYRWRIDEDGFRTAVFNVGEYRYAVSFDREKKNLWDVVFWIDNRPATKAIFDKSGTGNEFQVFSMVKKIIVDHASSDLGVNVITFTARGESRKRFYDRWSKQIIAALPGSWDLKTRDSGVRKYFLIRQGSPSSGSPSVGTPGE